MREDQQRAEQLKREVQLLTLEGDPGPGIVHAAAQGQYDLIVLALSRETSSIAEGILASVGGLCGQAMPPATFFWPSPLLFPR